MDVGLILLVDDVSAREVKAGYWRKFQFMNIKESVVSDDKTI